MRTGIFVRAQIDKKWEAVDIGDVRLPDIEVAKWLRIRGGKNVWAERVVMILLGRNPGTVED